MVDPAFSIVMASYLGSYPTAATKRNEKIIRAINSVVSQTFRSWELLVIADGCEKTFNTLVRHYSQISGINCYLIDKQPMWAGGPRNFGISKSAGQYVLYLDIDDYLGPDHLAIIYSELEACGFPDWVWFNDLEGSRSGLFKEVDRDIRKKFNHGTCNICHARHLDCYWPEIGTYTHDHEFVKRLIQSSSKSSKIKTPQYHVCHMPNRFDI